MGKGGRIWRRAAALAPLLLVGLAPGGAQNPAPPGAPTDLVRLAVIVHPKNPVTDLKLREIKAIFKLERQFWPSNRRVALFLPPSATVEKKVLLEKVYNMTNEELRKYWLGKVFNGDIPAIPPVVRTAKAAGEVVKKSDGAVAVVRSTEVPEGVTVLSIDGKKPADPDYPLVGKDGLANSALP